MSDFVLLLFLVIGLPCVGSFLIFLLTFLTVTLVIDRDNVGLREAAALVLNKAMTYAFVFYLILGWGLAIQVRLGQIGVSLAAKVYVSSTLVWLSCVWTLAYYKARRG